MKRWAWLLLAAGAPLFASGTGEVLPWTIDRAGGEAAGAIDEGRPGIILGGSSEARLFKAWRVLHGLQVGRTNLEERCCDAPVDEWTATRAWTDARAEFAPGAPPLGHTIDTSIPTGDYSSRPNCLADAFAAATEVLKARAASFGRGSPQVRAWLAGQDAVFATCTGRRAPFPPAPSDAPDWLRRDRAYQLAAQSLYAQDFTDAAARFAAIGRDRGSPYAERASYLVARALTRAALTEPSPAAQARARAAMAQVAARSGYGRASATGLVKALSVRERPDETRAALAHALLAPRLPETASSDFKDWLLLSRDGAVRHDSLRWIDAMRGRVRRTARPDDYGEPVDASPAGALDAAWRRWKAGGDTAWLLAALVNAGPGNPRAAELAAAAASIKPASPAYLTAQFHRWRLVAGEPDAKRAALDAVLARGDLTITDRNLFAALRLQVASDLADFGRHARRQRLCLSATGACRPPEPDYAAQGGDFAEDERVGVGEDAWAVIDRMPLAMRIALAEQPGWSAPQRLDLTLTSWARAVQLQDRAATDRLSRAMAVLLPPMRADFERIPREPAGARRRFAEFLVLAKIPGVRVDYPDYTRPKGTVDEFQYSWPAWFIAARPQPPTGTPEPDGYARSGGFDPVCYGLCGGGDVPARSPSFVVAQAGRAAVERRFFVGGYEAGKPLPPGVASVWEEMLGFAEANPADPRVPEALYWLVRVSRFGQSWNRSGTRAFQLLHRRYPQSSWTKRTPYRFD